MLAALGKAISAGGVQRIKLQRIEDFILKPDCLSTPTREVVLHWFWLAHLAENQLFLQFSFAYIGLTDAICLAKFEHF